MEKSSTELNSSKKLDFQENNPINHSDAIKQIATELEMDERDVEHLVRYYLTRVLSKIMLEKKNIYAEKLGKLTYKSLAPKKQKQIFELKNKPKKVIIRL